MRRYLPHMRPAGGWSMSTVVIWVGLVLAFVAFYMMAPEVGVWLLAACVAGALVLAIIGYFAWLVRRFRRFEVDNVEARKAIALGRLSQAAATFERWLPRYPDQISAMSRHNLAWTRIRQGLLDEALDLLELNHRRHGGKQTLAPIMARGALDLAFCYALLGDLETASAWVAETDRLRKTTSDPSDEAMHVFVRAVIECRAGRPDEAARLLDAQATALETVVSGDLARPMRVLRAFATATAGGPRGAGQVETILAQARPLYAGEYEFLATAWPELEAFLATHDLVRRR